MKRTSARNLALPALVIANAALACGPWLVRLAQADGGVGPVAAAFWRLALAAPLFAIVAWRRERPLPGTATRAMVAIAGLAFAIDLALWHVGILRTRLANAGLLANITALLFPLYGFWMARAWPEVRQWAALALAAIGIALLMGRSYALSPQHIAGDLACIAAGLCYTAYLIAVDRTRGGIGPITTLAIVAAVGAPLLLATALALGEGVWPRDWSAVLLLTLGSQLVGQGLLIYAVSRAAPIVVGLMLLLQPIVGAGIGWAAYGERLTAADAIGAIAIGAAVLMVRATRRHDDLPPSGASLSSDA